MRLPLVCPPPGPPTGRSRQVLIRPSASRSSPITLGPLRRAAPLFRLVRVKKKEKKKKRPVAVGPAVLMARPRRGARVERAATRQPERLYLGAAEYRHRFQLPFEGDSTKSVMAIGSSCTRDQTGRDLGRQLAPRPLGHRCGPRFGEPGFATRRAARSVRAARAIPRSSARSTVCSKTSSLQRRMRLSEPTQLRTVLSNRRVVLADDYVNTPAN
jgi:hypothetical protein